MAATPKILDRRSPVLHMLRPQDSVAEAAKKMSSCQVGAVAIVQGSALVGIFTERDLLCRVVALGRKPSETSLASVMTHRPLVSQGDDTRRDAIEKMRALNCRHLPIVVGHRVVDMASIRDLLFCELDDRGWEIDSLRTYINGLY